MSAANVPAAEVANSDSAGPELTLRALAIGCALGALLVVVNVYMGLKTGFNESGNITASLLGFALLRLFCRPSRLETNIVQTTATAAAAMCFTTGAAGLIPALALSGEHYSAWWFAPWGIALSIVGLALGGWFRERLLMTEQLPFPTGIATAEVIRTLHRSGAMVATRVRALLASGAVAGLLTWFRDGRPTIIPQTLMIPGRVFGFEASSLALGLAMSPMLLAAGALIGVHLATSVLIGAVTAWIGLAPMLASHRVVDSPEYAKAIGWLLWPAVALMLSSALTSLALDWRRFARIRIDVGNRRNRGLVYWAAAGALLAMIIGWRGLNVAPGWTALALLIAIVLSSVATRAAGETDVNPVGPMGQLTQLAYASATRDPMVNLAAAGVVTGVGMQMTTSIWSYKAGLLLRATPRHQLWAQLTGALVGALVAVPAYIVVARAFGVGSTALPAPGALALKAVADGVRGGAAALPPYGLAAFSVAFALGSLCTLLQRRPKLRLLPSPTAMAIGMLVPCCFGIAIFVGAALVAIVQRRWREWAGLRMQSMAAGAIAGEALVGVLIAALRVLAILR